MTSKALPLPKLSGFSERNGIWYAEEIPLIDLAKEYGTPLYVYSKKALTESYEAYDKACIDGKGKRRARIHYAMKANSNLAVIDLFKQLGAGFDLVSGGELARALAIGADLPGLGDVWCHQLNHAAIVLQGGSRDPAGVLDHRAHEIVRRSSGNDD